jgi:hypothetical protein
MNEKEGRAMTSMASRGWRIGMAGLGLAVGLVAGGLLAPPAMAQKLRPEPQVVAPAAGQRHWGDSDDRRGHGDRDDRWDRDRGRRDRDWRPPAGYGSRSYHPPYWHRPYPGPRYGYGPGWGPGQWVWNGWNWIWMPAW